MGLLRAYLQEINKTKLLDREEEIVLWQAYQTQNCLESRGKLIVAYQPLVFKIAISFKCNETMTMELLQEGNVALIECVDRFDYTKGVAFSLFALHRLRGQMIDYLKKNNPTEYLTDEMSANLPNTDKSAQSILEDSFIYGKIAEAMQRLPQREQQVLTGIYLKDLAIGELAQSIDVTPSYICKLHKQGINRVRGMLSRVWQNFK